MWIRLVPRLSLLMLLMLAAMEILRLSIMFHSVTLRLTKDENSKPAPCQKSSSKKRNTWRCRSRKLAERKAHRLDHGPSLLRRDRRITALLCMLMVPRNEDAMQWLTTICSLVVDHVDHF